MINREKAWTISVIAMGVIMVLMLYQASVICIYWVPVNLKFVTIMNISMSVLGMIVVFFIYLGAAFDKWLRGKAQNAFLLLCFYECLTLFSTFVYCHVNGNPDYIISNAITNYIYYSSSIFMPLFLWLYIYHLDNQNAINWITKMLLAFGILGIVVLMINAVTGIAFYIDDAGFYHRTDYVWVTFIFPMLIIFVSIIWGIFKTDTTIKKITIFIFVFFTLLFGIMQFVVSEMQLMYIGVLLSIIAVYSNTYVKKGYALAEKEMELNKERNAALISQIRPHFLYNVLNTIIGLDDVNTMRKSIVMFGKYLRGNLDIFSLESTIPFTNELEHIKTYVGLEKLRYEDNLQVYYDIREISFNLPPLCVQVLVENAIKHGISKREEGGSVTISTYSDGHNYYIEVQDTGVGFDTNKPISKEHSHIGVGNARTRLSNMVGGRLSIESKIGVGTKATITIPKNDGILADGQGSMA